MTGVMINHQIIKYKDWVEFPPKKGQLSIG